MKEIKAISEHMTCSAVRHKAKKWSTVIKDNSWIIRIDKNSQQL